MEFDAAKKVENPLPILENAKLVFARRGTQIVISATEAENKVQVRKIWTGPHKKEEIYEFDANEMLANNELQRWIDTLKAEGYKVRKGDE